MRHTRLDDSGLLFRYPRQRVSEDFSMIEADIGYNCELGQEHIGRIEPPPQTGFDDGDLYVSESEMFEGQRRDRFKKGEFFFTSTDRWRSMKATIERLGIFFPST